MMNRPSLALLAALAVLPFQVRAESNVDARRVVASAISKADDTAQRLSSVPLEFADLVPLLPYGTEYALPQQGNKTKAEEIHLVKAKAGYWEMIKKTLSLEAVMRRGDLAAYKGNDIGDFVRQVSKVGRLARAAAAIAADAKKDCAYVQSTDSPEETSQQMLDRKAQLFSELKGYKDAVAP